MKKPSNKNSPLIRFHFRDLKLYLSFIFGISLLSTTLHSCKPDPPDPPPVDLGFFPLGEIKEYQYFKPGSWWIYRNSLNGKLDSQIVDVVYLDTIPKSNKYRKLVYEDMQLVQHSKNNKWSYWNYTHGLAAAYKDFNWSFNMLTNKSGGVGGFAGEIETFFYPFEKDDGKSNYHISFQDTLKTFTLLGNTFKDVAVFFIYHDDLEDYPLKGHSAKYYWAKGVGLVYHEIRDFNDTSIILKKDELINYKIYK